MNERVRVNITTAVNSDAIKQEQRNGRDVWVVPSATLPDNIVMNNTLYPAEEIANSYFTLERSPAPFGHPTVNGKYVSASDPEAINGYWVGAWNENVRRENGKVYMDKVIDVEHANQSENGKAVLEALQNGDAIHTSTGLLCNLEEANDKRYKYVARNMEFDHDAILLNEEGAATPGDGVGIFVNSKGKSDEIRVINSVLEEAERDLEWAADMATRAVERMERASMIDRIVSAIKSAISADDGRETSANNGDSDMADDKQLEALSAKVDALTDANSKIGEQIATAVGNAVTEAMKPILEANQAQADAKRLELVNKVVAAEAAPQEVAEKMDEAALQAMLNLAEKATAKSGKDAAPIAGGFAINMGQKEDASAFSPLFNGGSK